MSKKISADYPQLSDTINRDIKLNIERGKSTVKIK